jgi:hypothetical protein
MKYLCTCVSAYKQQHYKYNSQLLMLGTNTNILSIKSNNIHRRWFIHTPQPDNQLTRENRSFYLHIDVLICDIKNTELYKSIR